MSSDVLPPNPCLVAILLVAKVNWEPHIVFHYPPRPGEDNTRFTRYLAAQENDKDGSSSTNDDSNSSHDEEPANTEQPKDSITGDNTPELDVEEPGSVSPEKNDIWRRQYEKPKWNDMFGLGAYGLSRLLCPPSTSHKQRFEMSIDDKVFLGRPIFAREGEHWRRKKKEKKKKKVKPKNLTSEDDSAGGQQQFSAQEIEVSTDASEHDGTPDKDRQVQEAVSAVTGGDQLSKDAASSSLNEQRRTSVRKDTLNMFHVVFVLDPPPLEYQLRVKEMDDHVIKKFSKALRWEQARSKMVLREVNALLRDAPLMKRAHTDDQPLANIYHRCLSRSPLAKAISVIYNNISTSRIAHINLTPSSSMSFQIPIPTSTSVLPGPLSPQMPGLWLTTATSLPADDDDVNMTSSQLASQFTILLLSDLSNILSEINDTSSSPLSAPLTHFLQISKPTKSFLQTSQSSGIPLPDIQFFASHLIYWRKARAIPPLHQRDTYIVSPNADMSKLVSATSKFAKVFPALPSLPKILNLLSTPRAYSTLIPSKDHKEAFMEILAWLLRDGWVTQLRTFVWVRVPPHIKASVQSQEGGGDVERSLESSVELLPRRTVAARDERDPNNNKSSLVVPLPPLSSSPTSSTTSAHTTIPFHASPETPPLLLPPRQTPSLIRNPRQASGISSRYLSAISIHILKTQGVEGQKAWNGCLKYFDGKHAVETIAAQEGWKRKRIAGLISGWEAEGLL
ncbi:MAG: hypothetical protein Q9219_007595, partial [cf. Caloplaca sp. 3 TL-2023]